MGDVVSLHGNRDPGAYRAASVDPSPASAFTCRAVARLLDVPERRLRSLVRAGVVQPERGPRGELRFTFADVALLRMLRPAMVQGRTLARVRDALFALQDQMPAAQPLSGVRLTVEGREVVAQEGRRRWLPSSGQALLDLEKRRRADSGVSSLDERRRRDDVPVVLPDIEPADAASGGLAGDEWYARGCELEAESTAAAQAAYRRALDENPSHPDAHINLGRLLHERAAQDPAVVRQAADHYRLALEARPGDPIAAFNLGVALQDLGRRREAVVAYEKAIAADPSFADAHCNLARLLAEAGQKQAALQHYHLYRRLRPDD